MPEAMMLHAAARIPLANPRAMLDKLCEHFVEHGTVTLSDAGGRIESPLGVALLETEGDALVLRAECPDEITLSIVKSALAEHVVMFAEDETLDFVWTGDHASDRSIPYFHEMTVVAARNVTPQMRRVTLTGADVAHFEHGGLHVRILIPPPGRDLVWPTMGHDGRTVWPKGEDELTSRIYTIRQIDKARGVIEIDVVLHGDNHTPGAAWAMRAQAGDAIGIMGPGGGDLPEADHYLLVGDETALPAIARIADALTPDKRATILLEVSDPSEQQDISSRAEIDVRWLHRNGREVGTTTSLAEAVRAFEGPDLDNTFVLVGCEHAAAKAIRSFLRKERGMSKQTHLVAAYWRRGHEGSRAGTDE
jgi:NADPH-dependent ferric siderophore reductase